MSLSQSCFLFTITHLATIILSLFTRSTAVYINIIIWGVSINTEVVIIKYKVKYHQAEVL